jgi:hypothetical protein
LAPPEVFLLTKHEYLILPASVVLGILMITIIHTGKSVLNNSISPHHVAQAWWLVDEHMPYIAFRSLVHRWMVQFSTVESWKTTHPGDDPSKSMRRTHDVWVFYGESCLQINHGWESQEKSQLNLFSSAFLDMYGQFWRFTEVSPNGIPTWYGAIGSHRYLRFSRRWWKESRTSAFQQLIWTWRRVEVGGLEGQIKGPMWSFFYVLVEFMIIHCSHYVLLCVIKMIYTYINDDYDRYIYIYHIYTYDLYIYIYYTYIMTVLI